MYKTGNQNLKLKFKNKTVY